MRSLIFLLAAAAFGQSINEQTQIKNKAEYNVRDYTFTRTNGAGASGNLTSTGSKTITLTPCPKGVAGTNTNHYVYISGGTGTAEAVLITGGTCTSGAATGTIIGTTANTHSGAWAVTSATAGFQEAINVGTSNGTTPASIVVIPGTYQFYAAVRIKGSKTAITGLGGRSLTSIVQNHTTHSGFVFDPGTTTTQTENKISGFAIVPGVGKTEGWGIEFVYQYYSEIADVIIDSIPSGVLFSNSQSIWFTKSAIRNFAATPGIGFKITGTGTGVDNYYFSSVEIVGGSGHTSTAAACINVVTGGGFIWNKITAYDCGGAGLLVNPQSGNEVRWGFVSDSNFDSGLGDGIHFQPNAATVKSWSFVNSWTASNNGDGVKSAGVSGGLVKGLNFTEHRSVGNGLNGMTFGTGTTDIKISGGKFAGNSTASAGVHAGITFVSGISNFSVADAHVGPYDSFTGVQGRGIYVAASGSDNYRITGNTLLGNTIAFEDQGTGTVKVIENNLVPNSERYNTVASAATITLPARDEPTILITGTTAINTMSPVWGGRKVRLIFTDVAPGGVATGGTAGKEFAKTVAATTNTPLDCEYANSKWYCK